MSDAATQLTWAFRAGRGAGFGGEWSYGLHAGCAGTPGVACHFEPHFPGCGPGTGPAERPAAEFAALPEAEFEAHPAELVPPEYRDRGVFWWYTQVPARARTGAGPRRAGLSGAGPCRAGRAGRARARTSAGSRGESRHCQGGGGRGGGGGR